MKELNIVYDNIKILINIKTSFYQTLNIGYNIFVVTSEFIVNTKIIDLNDVSDFETNYKSLCTEVNSLDDAIARKLCGLHNVEVNVSLVSISSSFTKRFHLWSAWRDLLLSKMGTHQYDDDGTVYTIWFYDEPEVHICNIWKENIPSNLLITYSQEQNDIDRNEFEIIYKLTANKRISLKSIDGRPKVLPLIFPESTTMSYIGAGDSDTTIGGGNSFVLSSILAETKTLEFSFKDWVYIAGGKIDFSGAVAGDYIDFYFYAPATSVTGNQNNTGNCNVENYKIFPADGNGSYDVNYSSAVPVPIGNEEDFPDGYWDWSSPDTGKGEVIPCDGNGYYNLYTVPINLTRFATKLHLLGTGSHDLVLPAVKVKKVLPHWKGKLYLTNSTLKPLSIVWYLVIARNKTC